MKDDKVLVLEVGKEAQQIGDLNSPWYRVLCEDGTVAWSYGAFIDL
jgi:hypothetical protein